MVRLAIFASGNGSNAQNIAEYFSTNPDIQISLICSNKADAFVLNRASELEIPAFVFTFQQLKETEIVLNTLKQYSIDWIILAGFLLKIPPSLVHAYPRKIINIHPALLSKYGGKGMYGSFVHQAVLESGDGESGITIHFVNEEYDEGDIIFQKKCPVEPNDTVDSLANRIHSLEFEHFPKVIEEMIRNSKNYLQV